MTIDYDSLVDRPRINGHVLTGDMSSEDLDIQGGSGNVDDVLVNGQSVVDEFKIAKIKSYKEVTQAEYNALPATKTEDDVMYCITDAHGVDGYPPLIYSDEEREVGVWRDGKPLYQKTINFGALPNNAIKDVSHGISNVDKIWISGGFAYQPNGNFANQLSLCVPEDLSSGWYFGVTSSVIRCATGSNRTAYSAYVTLQYTKTTDTAGAGTWTTQGAYAQHYSETEQIVGTWIDGKPLYEKTINFGTLPDAAEKFVAHNINNLKMITKLYGITSNTSGGTFPLPFVNIEVQPGYQIVLRATATDVVVRTGTDRTAFTNTYITIEYTKTTD